MMDGWMEVVQTIVQVFPGLNLFFSSVVVVATKYKA